MVYIRTRRQRRPTWSVGITNQVILNRLRKESTIENDSEGDSGVAYCVVSHYFLSGSHSSHMGHASLALPLVLFAITIINDTDTDRDSYAESDWLILPSVKSPRKSVKRDAYSACTRLRARRCVRHVDCVFTCIHLPPI